MLTFQDYSVEFGAPNFSGEHHGDEVKPLVSIYAEAVVHAANLESFKPGLMDALWKRPAVNDSQRVGDDGEVHELVCRFPTAKHVAFEDKFPGYGLVVHKSELFDDTKEWPTVDIAKIGVTPQDGGTARVKFRIQVRGDGLEWFVGMMNRAASITLTPPKSAPLPPEHPDTRADDTQEQLPIGEGPAPESDPLAGADVAHGNGSTVTVDTSAITGAGTSITGPAGPLMDAIAEKAGKRSGRRAAH